MILTSYPLHPQVLRRDNQAEANINVLAPGTDAQWNAPSVNTIVDATTTASDITLPSGTYMLNTNHYYQGGNRAKVSLQYHDGTNPVGPLSAGGYTRTTGGGIETSDFLSHLLIVPVNTTITLTVRVIRLGAAGATATIAGNSEWSVVRLGNAV